MPLIFADSFGHYTGILDKWGSAGDNQIVLPNASQARTGNGCLQIISGSFGPARGLGATSGATQNFSKLILQVASNFDGPGASQQPTIFQFQVAGGGYNIAVRVNGDSSLSIWRGAGDTAEVELFRTAFRPYVWTTWNSIECQVFFDSVAGTVVLRCNGRQVANLSGIRTVRVAGTNFSNAFQLFGTQSNGNFAYLADLVVIDWSTAPNNTFIPQAKVYVEVPNANSVPLQWTPLAGTNFSEVNEIPPDGDTSYNSSSTVGQIDQYRHPSTGIPGAATIACCQTNLDMKIDSGARSVASDLAGTIGGAFALTTAYQIYTTPSDTDPSPFPVNAGPKVTA